MLYVQCSVRFFALCGEVLLVLAGLIGYAEKHLISADHQNTPAK